MANVQPLLRRTGLRSPAGFEMLFNEVYAQVYDRVLRENSGSRKHEQEGVSGLRADVLILTGCETAKKISEVIKNPDSRSGA